MATKPTPHISSRDPDELFELIKQIGSGSYGSVHQARVKKTGKLAAIKMINMEDGEEFDDVMNEIALLERCKHEGVVGYFGSFVKNRSIWICMEFCGGGSVADAYAKLKQGLTESQIAHVTYYSLEALEYLHQSHLVHRDIKGGNILLTLDGQVKLADLGVSAQLSSTLAKRKSFIGTPYWIAPEIIAVEMKMGPDGYNSRCDVWSMGITCIEMAEMQPPMFDLHPMRALYLIPKSPAPKLNEKGKWSKDFREFIKAVLVKNPAKRPSAGSLTKHSFFKQMKTHPTALVDLVKQVTALGDKGGLSLVQEFEMDEGTDVTLKPSKQRVSAALGDSGDYAELPMATVSLEDTPNESKAKTGDWYRNSKDYVPVSPIYANLPRHKPGLPPRSPSKPAGHAAPTKDAARTSAPQGASSFVLSNVFAGCPLKVLCAASWKYQPPGQEPFLYIIVGADTGLYVLETSGDKRELVQVSRRQCTWLYVMDEEGIMISVSDVGGRGQVCVHDLNSLLVGPNEDIRFKTTRLLEGTSTAKCAVTRTPDTGFTFLCVAVPRQLLLMQWYAPRRKFMKLKDFQTPFDEPPKMMELLVLDQEPLPVLCVGATRDKKTRGKQLSLVNPNYPPEKLAKHMSAELGWVRVRSGREDIYATAVKQIGRDRFMLCFSNVATFIDQNGEGSIPPGEPDKIIFETQPDVAVYTPDAVIGFSRHRMERRSVHTGKITHQMKDARETFRVVGKEGNIIIEAKTEGEDTSHLYLLIRK
eukprot:m.61501 g.61501  ORF g.61501 m.61501 type:complete len:755 (-) comp13344_c1_seq1:176-2440(-)